MLDELSVVTLTRDISEEGLRRGAIGTIVHVYPNGAAYEVEFDRIEGKSVPLATLAPGDIRLATDREIALAQQTAQAAK